MVDLRLGNPLFNGTQRYPYCITALPSPLQPSADQPASAPQDFYQATVPLLDTQGYHAATCKYAMGATRRHNRIRDLMNVVMRDPAIALRPQVEWTFPSQLSLPTQNRERLDVVVDDIAFFDGLQGYDVTVVSPHNRTYLPNASKRAAGAATKAEQAKVRKYQELCLQNGIAFTPVGLDIHGALGPCARRAFKQIADFAATRKATSPAAEYRRLTLRVITRALQLTASAVNRRMTSLDHYSTTYTQQ